MALKYCSTCGVNTNSERVFRKSSDSPTVDAVYHQYKKTFRLLKYYIPAILFFSLVIFVLPLAFLGGKTDLFGINIFWSMIIVGFLAGLPFYLIGIICHRGGSKVRCLTCKTVNKNPNVPLNGVMNIQRCTSCGFLLRGSTYCHVCPKCTEATMVHWH